MNFIDSGARRQVGGRLRQVRVGGGKTNLNRLFEECQQLLKSVGHNSLARHIAIVKILWAPQKSVGATAPTASPPYSSAYGYT